MVNTFGAQPALREGIMLFMEVFTRERLSDEIGAKRRLLVDNIVGSPS
jgi:hypothetical protein